jgi:hypothetical protein
MEHIVRTIELPEEVDEAAATALPVSPAPGSSVTGDLTSAQTSRASSRSSTRMSARGEDAAAEALRRNADARRRLSSLSMTDVADRQLRDKTDAIAYIIRNISEQCAAAVEGLNMAHRAESAAGDRNGNDDDASLASSEHGGNLKRRSKGRIMTRASLSDAASEYDDRSEGSASSNYSLHDARSHTIRSSIPPTPDLVHSHSGNTLNRSSTSMSMISSSTAATPDRVSVQSHWRNTLQEDIPELPAKIVRAESGGSGVDEFGGNSMEDEEPVNAKYSTRGLEHRFNMRAGN